MFYYVLAFVIGGLVGVFAMALMNIAKDSDDE